MVFMVSVDPATGGGSSQPAFAVWEVAASGATLLDCGTVKVKGTTHWKRMRDLSFALPAALLNSFGGNAEMLNEIHCVIEGLPPTIGKIGGGNFCNSSSVHLHHSAAVLCTCLDWASVSEIAVITWKSFLKGVGLFEYYFKDDMNDAIILGLTYIALQGLPPVELDLRVFKRMFPTSQRTGFPHQAWLDWAVHIHKSREKGAKKGKK